MRKQLKEINIDNKKFVFDGANFELYKINDEDIYQKYREGEDIQPYKSPQKSYRSKIVFNFSNSCNLKCKYCYADGGTYSTKHKRIMTQEVFDGIVSHLQEDGVKRIDIVSFFGGEPLLNYKLIKHALPLMQQSFQVGIFEIVTNGWFLNKEKILLFQEYNVRLVISCDGPEIVTDYLRGPGTYKKAMQAYDLAKNLGYDNISISATYTKEHEEKGYSYNDVVAFFEKMGIEVSVSRVLSDSKEIVPKRKMSLYEIKNDIDHSIVKILKKDKSGNINPFLYRVLLSIVYGARSFNFCDDLSSRWQVSYDYDGKAYNCFHFWGDDNYSLSVNEETTEKILIANDKNRLEICRNCWAKYFCKVCTAAVIQGTYDLFPEKEKCVDQEIYEYIIHCIIKAMEQGQLDDLLQIFKDIFVIYKVGI